jgi:hypothetical protein
MQMYHGCTVVAKRNHAVMMNKSLLKVFSRDISLPLNEIKTIIHAAIKESTGPANAMILYPVINVPIHLTM